MKKIFPALLLLFHLSCEKEEPLPESTFQSIAAFDMGNSTDASDIVVQIKMDPKSVSEVHLLVSMSSTLTAGEASQAPAASFLKVIPAAATVVKLPDLQKTISGENFENKEYFVYALAIGSKSSSLLSKPSSITLSDKPIYAGKYTGTFHDNFGAKNASVILADDYTGQMFYTQTFVSFCNNSTANDGTLTLAFNGDDITDFTFHQFFPCFMAGCDGNFTGTGVVVDYLQLVVNFTGLDCEGNQSGVMTLNRHK